MKTLTTFLIILIFSAGNCFSFWIWSPKTNKWKNPKYTTRAGPTLQLLEALSSFNDKNYKRALKEFRGLINRYPDAQEAAEAQYYMAKCFECINKPYRAFLEYEKLIKTYPNTKRIQDAVEREYCIGEFYLGQKDKKFLGIPMNTLTDHPAIEIFQAIVETSPYSEYAPRSLYKLGLLLVKLSRYAQARETFNKLIDDYPENTLSDSAKYNLALAISKSSEESDYDQSAVPLARERLQELINKDPKADISQEAASELDILSEKEAKKNFEIALFYEKQEKFKSALVYYRIVVEKYPSTHFAEESRKKINLLNK